MRRLANAAARAVPSVSSSLLILLVTLLLAAVASAQPAPSAPSAPSTPSVPPIPPIPAPPDPDDVLLIGFVGPLQFITATGATPSVRFTSMINAVQLAIDAANRQKPRLGGQPVSFRLLTQDDRSDPRTAALVAQYLVKRRVVGVIGHGNATASMGATPVYHQAGIPLVSPTVAARAYTSEGFETSFRVLGHTDRGAEYLAQYLARSTAIRRVAVLDNSAVAGHAFAEQFVRAARANGLEITSHASVSDKTSDFNGVLGNIIRNQRADAVFWGGLDDQSVVIVQAMRRLQMALPLISGANGIVDARFVERSGPPMAGIIALEAGQPWDQLKGWKTFQRDYEQQFGGRVDRYAPLAFDAAQVLIAAVLQADSRDPARITAALHTIRFNGLTGPIAFTGEGDLSNPAFSIYRLQTRDWELVQTVGGGK